MVDKIIDADLIAAKRLAEEMEEVYLDLGVTTFNEQLPYFLELMQKHKLNCKNPDHLRMARDSLEERLNAKENEIEMEEPRQQKSIFSERYFEDFFMKECERVKDELINIYHGYKSFEIQDFKYSFFIKPDENCYMELILESPRLTVRYADNRESDEKIWNSKKCLHGLFDIKIEGTNQVEARACSHISNNTFNNYSKIAKTCFEFYMEKTTEPHEAESFLKYFDMLKDLPKEIMKYASPEIRKEIQEENKKILQSIRERIINIYLLSKIF